MMTPCPTCNWPHHSAQPIVMTCIKCGASVVIGDIPQSDMRPTGPKRKPPAKIPTIPEQEAIDSRLIGWVRWLRTPEDTGVGDTVERLLAKAGGRKIKKMLERIGVGCGCTDRQAALNRKYPY